jgi:hypothetical protein
MFAQITDVKHRLDHLESEVARLKTIADQAADLRDRVDALTKLLLRKDVVTAEETAAMLLARRGRRRKKLEATKSE